LKLIFPGPDVAVVPPVTRNPSKQLWVFDETCLLKLCHGLGEGLTRFYPHHTTDLRGVHGPYGILVEEQDYGTRSKDEAKHPEAYDRYEFCSPAHCVEKIREVSISVKA
jgi:hypothetical protein